MKLVAQTRNVSGEGLMRQQAFNVQVGAHIMSVLSGLYKNPIDAMVREYLTNMNDACVALERTGQRIVCDPILHAPTVLAPDLVFEDFGIGMSPDTVWSIFATYGASTKNESNDETGGFGLGSKVAFCYNSGQSWSIESRWQGTLYTFVAYISESGIPTLNQMAETPTDQPNGITIRIPILREHFEQVYAAIRRYAPYFPRPLTVLNLELPDRSKSDVLVCPTSKYPWRISHRMSDIPSGLIVVMGGVPYRVFQAGAGSLVSLPGMNRAVLAARSDARLSELTDNTITALSILARNMITHITVPVGSIEIVPSRDDLKYTDQTAEIILDACRTVVSDLPDVISEKLKNNDTEWDAINFANRVMGMSIGTSLSLMPGINSLRWKGRPISTKHIRRRVADLQALDSNMSIQNWRVDPNGRGTIVNEFETELSSGMTARTAPPRTTPADFVSVTPCDETSKVKVNSYDPPTSDRPSSWVIIDDMPTKGLMYCRALLFDKLVAKTAQGRARSWGHREGNAVFLKNTTLTKAQLSTFFGGMPEQYILRTSELSGIKVPSSLQQKKATIYKWNGRHQFEARATIPTTPQFYVPLDQAKHSHRWVYCGVPTGMLRELDMLNLWSIAERLGIVHGTISHKSLAPFAIFNHRLRANAAVTATTIPTPVPGSDGTVAYGVKRDEVAAFAKNHPTWVNLETAITDALTYVWSRYKSVHKVSRELKVTPINRMVATLINNWVPGKHWESSIGDFMALMVEWRDATRDPVINELERITFTAPGFRDLTNKDLSALTLPTTLDTYEKPLRTKYPLLFLMAELMLASAERTGYGGSTGKAPYMSLITPMPNYTISNHHGDGFGINLVLPNVDSSALLDYVISCK